MCERLKTDTPSSSIHSFNRMSTDICPSTYSVPGTVLGTYYGMINEIGIAPRIQPGMNHQPQINRISPGDSECAHDGERGWL